MDKNNSESKRTKNKEYQSFAHEIASLKRREKNIQSKVKDDDISKASGTLCAACGLECSVVPAERTTCQKCHGIHYCSPQCLQWHWVNGHEDDCPKKPVPSRLGFLKLQQQDPTVHSTSASEAWSGLCCNACGLECRPATDQERTICPYCKQVQYCNAECRDWDLSKGGHKYDCPRSPFKAENAGVGASASPPRVNRIDFTQFHQTLDRALQQPHPALESQKYHLLQVDEEANGTVAEHTIHASMAEWTEETYESEEVDNVASKQRSTQESSDDAKRSREEEVGYQHAEYEDDDDDDDDDKYVEEEGEEQETFLDEVIISGHSEHDENSWEPDMETLQINQYGSAMAAHAATRSYHIRRATPPASQHNRHSSNDTPETLKTLVTSNQQLPSVQNQPSPLLSREALLRLERVHREQRQYQEDIERYYSQSEPPVATEPISTWSSSSVQVAIPLAMREAPSNQDISTRRLDKVNGALERYRKSGDEKEDDEQCRQPGQTAPVSSSGRPPLPQGPSHLPPPPAQRLDEQSSTMLPTSIYLIEEEQFTSPPTSSPLPPQQQQQQQVPSSSAYYNVVASITATATQQRRSSQRQQLSEPVGAYYEPVDELAQEQVQQQQAVPSSSACNNNVLPVNRPAPTPRPQVGQSPAPMSSYYNASQQQAPVRQQSQHRAAAASSPLTLVEQPPAPISSYYTASQQQVPIRQQSQHRAAAVSLPLGSVEQPPAPMSSYYTASQQQAAVRQESQHRAAAVSLPLGSVEQPPAPMSSYYNASQQQAPVRQQSEHRAPSPLGPVEHSPAPMNSYYNASQQQAPVRQQSQYRAAAASSPLGPVEQPLAPTNAYYNASQQQAPMRQPQQELRARQPQEAAPVRRELPQVSSAARQPQEPVPPRRELPQTSSAYYNQNSSGKIRRPEERLEEQEPYQQRGTLPLNNGYNDSPPARAAPQSPPPQQARLAVSSQPQALPSQRGILAQGSSRRPVQYEQEDSGLFVVPETRIQGMNRAQFDDMEIGTSAGTREMTQGRKGNYEFSSLNNQQEKRRQRTYCWVCLSFTIGIILAVACGGGVLWYKPDLIINRDSGSNNNKNGELPEGLGPISLSLTQKLQSSLNGFGARVSLTDSVLAVGTSAGKVATYSGGGGKWTLLQELNAPVSNSGYGADIDVAEDDDGDVFMIVGAPNAGNGGSLYLYAYRPALKNWGELKISLAGMSGYDRRKRRLGASDDEKFGRSIGMSRNWRMVIGAPQYGTNASDSGRVYIFHLSKSETALDLLPFADFDLEGSAPGAKFGSAVDISEDGMSIAVGAPGQQKLYIYRWSGDQWVSAFQLQYPQDIDLGMSVVFLSNNYVAVGAPSASGSRGIVRVCKKEGQGWKEVGSIAGEEENDLIGSFGSIGGTEGPRGPELVFSTSKGVVRRSDLADGQWFDRLVLLKNLFGTSIAVRNTTVYGYELLLGIRDSRLVNIYSEKSSGSVPSGPFHAPAQPGIAPAPSGPSPTSAPPVNGPPSPQAQPSPSPPTGGNQPTMLSPPAPGAEATQVPATTPQQQQPTAAHVTGPTRNAPTTSPTPTTEWRLVGSSFTSSNFAKGFGQSVAVAGDFMVVSEPLVSNDIGQVRSYRRSSQWNYLNNPVFDDDALLFGSSVDLAVVNGIGSVLIGAKKTEAPVGGGGVASFGSASYYELDASGNYVQLGSTLKPPPDLFEAGGAFGGSVAMASFMQRVAIAAPDSSQDSQQRRTGRIYTYEFVGSEWLRMTNQPIFGPAEYRLGMALAMSKNGSRLLAGAPKSRGGAGSIFYYEWNDASAANPNSGWKQILSLPGNDRESFGSSVAILDESGQLIAFGAPSHGIDGEGLVRLYRDFGIAWFQEGSDIVGGAGERIGKTLCGAQGRVAFGTDSGKFHVYEYNGSTWVEVATGPSLGSPVVSISMSEDAKTVVVGLQNEHVSVYELS